VAKQFVVYFPFDQYILTPEAQTVVQQAAQYANDGHATRIVVVGHTDTSGSVKYNLRLSERRAKAVADALVGLGVPQTVLNVDWKGKTDLAVQTPDGVKEPSFDDRHQLLIRQGSVRSFDWTEPRRLGKSLTERARLNPGLFLRWRVTERLRAAYRGG
jgi:hypothetical protein